MILRDHSRKNAVLSKKLRISDHILKAKRSDLVRKRLCQHIKIPFSILGFIIQHTMAVSLKLGVSNLIAEFLAHTFVFLGHLILARAVSALCLKSLFNACYDFLILVKPNHIIPL